jgi:hypothetical protein
VPSATATALFICGEYAEEYSLEVLGIDGMIILKLIFKK